MKIIRVINLSCSKLLLLLGLLYQLITNNIFVIIIIILIRIDRIKRIKIFGQFYS